MPGFARRRYVSEDGGIHTLCSFQLYQLLNVADTGMTVRVRVVRVTPLIYDESGHLASSPMTS